MTTLPPELTRLAQEAGVLTSYHDISGREQVAGTEGLLAVLRALGLDIHSPDQASAVLRHQQVERSRLLVDPVVVHWVGEPFGVTLRLPGQRSNQLVELSLKPEGGGESFTYSWPATGLPSVGSLSADAGDVQLKKAQPPWSLPPGYHTLEVSVGGERFSALVVSAPPRANSTLNRAWGVFAPLFALRSARNWGIGDFGDLGRLAGAVGEHGAELVGTLPLYASFLDEPCDPSPYSPCSRLFWNEVFIDIEAVPEWAACEEARTLAGSTAFQGDLARLRKRRYVDHRAVMQHKRAVLERMSKSLAVGLNARSNEFKHVLAEDSGLVDYCRFRAAMEKAGNVWQTWPDKQRSGTLGSTDYDESHVLYHAYVQWVTQSQLKSLVSDGHRGAHLYLDLPLGVHPSGYDVFKHQDLFMQGASAGAPPDTFFSGGQDWGFPPLNPWRLRQSHYGYFIQVLHNTFRYATALRVDHIMGLHRLFVIPQGAKATEGVYVRFPAEELYAVLLLEAHRSGCRLLVGEDLGTVPDEVRREMDQRGLARMFVWQYELEPNHDNSPKSVPPGQVASLNTHDMPTFTGFSNSTDVHDRFRLGLLSQPEVEQEKARRQDYVTRGAEALRASGWLSGPATSRSLLSASLAYLASSASRLVMVSLEDLWLEADPQNVPGTYRERPNWTRKARYPLEKGLEQNVVRKTLKQINSLRKQAPSGD